jgi:hypothetical protein
MTAEQFLSLLAKIPHLLELAMQQDGLRRYEIQKQMRAQFRAEGRPFLYSMPMRHFCSCPDCGWQTTDILHELEDPRRGRKIVFSEIVLHQAQAHAAPPCSDLVGFLEACLKEVE